MSTEPTRTPAAEDLLRDVTTHIEATEHERRELEGSVANLRVRLAAAEKRAEEAEAKLRTLSGRVHGLGLAARNLAFATPDRTLRAELERCARLCEEAKSDAADDAEAPAEPCRCRTKACTFPPERDGWCSECWNARSADEAEARRDARRDYP